MGVSWIYGMSLVRESLKVRSMGEVKEPDMPDVDVVWKDIGKKEWECDVGKEEVWTVRQGTGADCSVAAGLGVSLEHNRLWDSRVRHPQRGYSWSC
jgi:hypothetical protein